MPDDLPLSFDDLAALVEWSAIDPAPASTARIRHAGSVIENAAEFHYVVAGLLRRRGRALLVHRSPRRRWYPNLWDLPGGHVNETESAADALRRELDEELGITVPSLGEPFQRLHGNDFRMDVWVVDRWLGEPENRDRREHDALAWVDADEAAGLELVHPHLLELLAAVLDPR